MDGEPSKVVWRDYRDLPVHSSVKVIVALDLALL
jgi:hypothetical protein